MRCIINVCLGLTLLAVSAFGANSPIDKGSAIVGGQLYFTNLSGDLYGDGATIVALNPSFGAFLSPGFLLGGEIQVLYQSSGGSDHTSFAVGPRIGYYFSTETGRASFKGSVYPYAVAFGLLGQPGESVTSYVFGGGGGAVVLVSNAVGVDFGAQLSFDTWSSGGYSESGLTVAVGIGITAFVY